MMLERAFHSRLSKMFYNSPLLEASFFLVNREFTNLFRTLNSLLLILFLFLLLVLLLVLFLVLFRMLLSGASCRKRSSYEEFPKRSQRESEKRSFSINYLVRMHLVAFDLAK